MSEVNDRLKEKLEEVYEHEFTLTANKDAITQSERNELKYSLTDIVADVLKDSAEIYITRTIDGYVLEIQNETLGLIPIELQLKVKNLNYDIGTAEDLYKEKMERKNQKKNK